MISNAQASNRRLASSGLSPAFRHPRCSRRWLVVCLWLFLLLLGGCADGRYSGTFIFDGTHSFTSVDPLPGDMLIRAGNVVLHTDAQVGGSVYVLGGALDVDGLIMGDLVVLDGRVTLGPTARIGGDLRIGNGTTKGSELALVEGSIISGLTLPVEQATLQPTSWEAVVRWFVGALLLAVLGGLWARQRPQPLHNIGAAATGNWPAATALGLLVLFVLPILLVMMTMTVVLIPLVLLIGLGMVLALGMGIVALGHLLGIWLQQRWLKQLGPGRATFLGTLMLMGLYGLPLVGGMLLALTTLLSYGALLLTRFGVRAYEPPIPSVVEDLATYRRPL